MKPVYITGVLLCVFTCSVSLAQVSTQQTPKGKPDKRIFTGGNIGLQFGTITIIDISPLVGYRVTERFAVGIGATYQYYRYKDNLYNFSTNIYGGRVFSRFSITENLLLHGEYELLNLEAYDDPGKRLWVPGLLAGGGYQQEIGPGAYLQLMVLWNFLEDKYTPYQNPIIRGGVSIGL